eukprot:Gb_16681 [translate_table: standard]
MSEILTSLGPGYPSLPNATTRTLFLQDGVQQSEFSPHPPWEADVQILSSPPMLLKLRIPAQNSLTGVVNTLQTSSVQIMETRSFSSCLWLKVHFAYTAAHHAFHHLVLLSLQHSNGSLELPFLGSEFPHLEYLFMRTLLGTKIAVMMLSRFTLEMVNGDREYPTRGTAMNSPWRGPGSVDSLVNHSQAYTGQDTIFPSFDLHCSFSLSLL